MSEIKYTESFLWDAVMESRTTHVIPDEMLDELLIKALDGVMENYGGGGIDVPEDDILDALGNQNSNRSSVPIGRENDPLPEKWTRKELTDWITRSPVIDKRAALAADIKYDRDGYARFVTDYSESTVKTNSAWDFECEVTEE